MPQPDNKRTRGSNAPRLEGTKVSPEGTSGVFNTYGVARNVAATQRTSGIQIGQQARIIDDGSSLYMALQGLAQGIEKGVQQYDHWETKIAEKRQNDWETELIEFGRTVNNNPKKMAEWARLSDYSPNHKTAKRYNSLMAEMEGKEYDAYQDDLIFEVSAAASKMDMSTAARYYAEEMAKLDPTDKAYAAFARSSNELNKQMTSLSTKFDLGQTAQGYDVGIFDLGAQLRANGITAADLASERASVVGAAYNFWGTQDPSRMSIAKNGDITYTSSDGMVYTGSFNGGLNENLIQAMRADLGSAAGSMDDNTFNSRIAANVELAIAHGSFNREHTTRGTGGGSQTLRLDVMRGVFSNPAFDVTQQRAVFVDTISLPAGATDAQKKAHTKKVMDEFVESIVASDMSDDAKIEALNNFIIVANPENNSIQYEMSGYAGDLMSSDISGPLNKARAEVRQINLNAGKEEAQRVDNAVYNSLQANEIRNARQGGVFNLLRRFTTVGDSGQPPHLVLQDGRVLTGVDEIRKEFNAHPDASVDAVIHIVDNRLTNPEFLGNGVWIGKADAPAPKEAREWQLAQRKNYTEVLNFNRVIETLEQGREVTQPDAVAAFDTVLSKLPPSPNPSDVAPALTIMLGGAARQNWGDKTKAEMTAKIIDMSSTGSGAKLQQIFAITAEQAFEYSQFTPEGLAAAAANPETAEDIQKFTLIGSLLADPSTRELGTFLSGDKNGTAAWYMTTGQTLAVAFAELNNGEQPSAEWMRLARNFEYMPAVTALGSETVDLLWQLSSTDQGEVGQLALALTSTTPSDDPSVIVARQLRDAWDSAIGEGESKFLDILMTPDHKDRPALERWTQRYAARMSGAAALVSMMQSDGYGALTQQRNIAARGGQVINSPTMQQQNIADMWRAAARAVGPPTGGFMTIENADASTVSTTDPNGVPVDTRTQAVSRGLQYLNEVTMTRRGEGLNTAEGDLFTLVRGLGLTQDMTGDLAADNQILAELASGDPWAARATFVSALSGKPLARERKWYLFTQELNEIFVPEIDYLANSEARNVTDANFTIKINPLTEELPVYLQDLIDRPFDNPNDPLLRFTRTAPSGQQGPNPQMVEHYSFSRIEQRVNTDAKQTIVQTTADALVPEENN